MSRRLTADRQGKAPTLSLRLTEAMAAEVEQARTALAAAAPVGIVVSLSDAARVLLGEALAARRAAAAAPVTRAAPPPLPPRPRTSHPVTVDNDPPDTLPLPMGGLDGDATVPRRQVDREALRQRVEAALAPGRTPRLTLRGLARLAGVDESSIRNWRTGTRGLSELVARKLSDAIP